MTARQQFSGQSITCLYRTDGDKKARTIRPVIAPESPADAVEVKVNDGSCEQGQHLADHQTTYNRDSKRFSKFSAGAQAEGHRQSSKERAQCGHHDRAES